MENWGTRFFQVPCQGAKRYNEVFGRCNGAVGKVVVADIVYDENCRPLPLLPKCVLTGRL
jgi:hypothetical protein